MRLYIYIILLFCATTLIAQSIEIKTIHSNSKTLVIELESIDNLQLITGNQENKFKISSEDTEMSTIPNVYVDHGAVYIKVTSDLNKIKGSEKIKYRAGQPQYPKYIIELPININTTLLYESGNFTVNNYKGNLDVHIRKYGNIQINDFIGSISIKSFSGKIDCTLASAKIDVETRKGMIESLLTDDRLNHTKMALKGIYLKPDNKLNIKTIHAKVKLKPVNNRK